MFGCVLISLLLLSTSYAHVFRFGSCPDVDVQKDFDINKFLGRWYVLQRFRTESSCVIEEVTKGENGTYYLMEELLPFGGTAITQKGKISFVEGEPASVMKVDFPMSRPLGSQNYWVMMTDYDNYAAIWHCQRLPVGHRQSAEILSRKPTLGREYVKKIRKRFEEFGVNEHYFSFVDHKQCGNITQNNRVDQSTNNNNTNGFALRVGPFKFSAN